MQDTRYLLHLLLRRGASKMSGDERQIVTLISDSLYVIKAINDWMARWKACWNRTAC